MTARTHWTSQRERGVVFAMRALRWIAVNVGRRAARGFLWPITFYFTATSAATRRASREFLARVFGRRATWRDVLRHVHTFAAISLDRVFLLTRSHRFDVSVERPARVIDLVRRRGTLMFVAHFGSFEVMRTGAVFSEQLPLKVVLDLQVGQRFMDALAELAPDLAANIIDSSRRGPEHVLAVRDALDGGALVGMMIDRARAEERTVGVRFLDGIAQFPIGPWALAAALKAPVIGAFGTYRGGNQYDVRFEVLSEGLDLPREGREDALRDLVQQYASRLEHEVRRSPFNWFNFYDFWHARAARD